MFFIINQSIQNCHFLVDDFESIIFFSEELKLLFLRAHKLLTDSFDRMFIAQLFWLRLHSSLKASTVQYTGFHKVLRTSTGSICRNPCYEGKNVTRTFFSITLEQVISHGVIKWVGLISQFCHDYVGDLSRKTNKIKPKNHETAVWL